MGSTFRVVALAGVLHVIAGARPAAAQELEPRAYSASPVGATFLGVGVSRSSGGVFTDPSLPIQDVRATIGAAALGAGHTFDLFSRTALVLVSAPYARGRATGRTEEASREVTRVGWADARVKFSINLLGGRALRPAEFAKTRRTVIIGMSLTTVLPTGQYSNTRLVNLGSNRWSFKPEAGISIPVNQWTFDAYGGLWMFTDNDAFFPGNARRTQDPVLAVQGHVSYTFRPRLWLAGDATFYSGGTTTVDGVSSDNSQRNSRLGATVSIPLGERQSLKAAYSTGATTRVGGDFNTIAVGWQMTWLRR